MSDAFDPQSQLADDPGAPPPDVPTDGAAPSPEQLNEGERDGSGGELVGGLPTDESPDAVEQARERAAWDDDAQESAGVHPADEEGE